MIGRAYRRTQHVATMVAITPLLYILEALSVSNPNGVEPEFWHWIWRSMWEKLDPEQTVTTT